MHKYRISPLNLLLLPLSLLYGLVVRIRNILFDYDLLPSREFKLPVISVGNITVGGTGKTPHIEYLVNILKDEFSIATLSRGYRRKTRQFIIATKNSSASEIGDEPRQLKQKYPDLIVAVDRDRVHGIRKLIHIEQQVDVILLDDAYQHRYVKPGKSILLIDFNRLITNDLLLPAGRLREPASGKNRADIILVTKSPRKLKPMEMRSIVMQLGLELHQHLYFTTVKYENIVPVFNSIPAKKESWFKERKVPVLLLTGIANPRPLRTFARSISTTLHVMRFPDHHYFTVKNLQAIEERLESIGHPDTLILTTEKDAMRLQETEIPKNIKERLYYVPIRVTFLNDDQDEFNQLILNYVRSNKRDNILLREAN